MLELRQKVVYVNGGIISDFEVAQKTILVLEKKPLLFLNFQKFFFVGG